MIALEDIIRLVRQAINEYATVGDELSAEIDASLIDFIKVSAPVIVMEVSPAYHIAKKVSYDSGTNDYFVPRPDGMLSIRIPLPNDFCRFVSMKADSWLIPALLLYSDGHSSFEANYSAIPGIGNGPASPRAYLTSGMDEASQSCIVAHSVAKADNFALSYIAVPEVTETDITMDARLDNALAYYAASLYLQSITDVNGSKGAYNMAKNIIDKLNNIATL